jgi:serine/threonine protein kinase
MEVYKDDITNRYTILKNQQEFSGSSKTSMLHAIDNETGQKVFFRIYLKKIMVSGEKTKSRLEPYALPMTKMLENEVKVYKTLRNELVCKPTLNMRNFLCILADGSFTKAQLLKWLVKSIKIDETQALENIYRTIFFMLDIDPSSPRTPLTKISKETTRIKDVFFLEKIRKYAFLDERVEFGFIIMPIIEDKVTLAEYMRERFFRENKILVSDLPAKLSKQIKNHNPNYAQKQIDDILTHLTSKKELEEFYDWIEPYYEFIKKNRYENINFPQSWQMYKDQLYSECINVFFVILLCVSYLAKIGINHNDIHLDNVLLNWNYTGANKYHKNPYLIVYGEYVMLIDNLFIPIIFDFDRAVVKDNTENNKVIEAFGTLRSGNCPSFHEKRDILRILCSLCKLTNVKYGRYNKLCNEVLKDIISVPELIREIENTTEDHCTLEIDNKDDSALCWDRYLDSGVKDNWEIVDWFLKQTTYKKFRLSEFIDVSIKLKQSPYYKNIRLIINEFGKGLGENIDKITIFSNIQFVSAGKNFEFWQENGDQTMNFVNIIYSMLKNKL